ncbi:MAG: ABC transporter ATP-binding protein [Betaproteobacteria bacterium]|nr:ABC transporter ATP-binding protein [Betaproteobacteria bacterium]
MNEGIILETKDLVKEFKGFVAVSGVGLKVKRGHIHALIGPNGAGKTTVFNLLTKFLIPTSGRIFYQGEDITPLKSAQIARKGVIRSLSLTPKAMELLNTVGLTEFADHITVELPYGRKRALEIATTLAMDPQLMLLDEPTQGMGHEDVERVTQLIKTVSANRTVLMVEHNMGVVSKIADRISVLQRGQIIAEGPYETVSKDPQVLEAYMGSSEVELQGAH